MGKPYFVTGSVTCDAATLANIDVNIGFVPSYVEVQNRKLSAIIKWDENMANGHGHLEGDVEPDGILLDPRPSIGTTNTQLANVASGVRIAGANKAIAAVAAGTALTATTVPQNKWGVFGFEVGINGTLDAFDDSANATGYASEALALAHYLAQSISASHVLAFYVAVMNTAAGGFVGATTALNATTVTAHYYSATLANVVTSGGITPLNSSGTRGFRIGTNSNIQYLGDTLVYRAWRSF